MLEPPNELVKPTEGPYSVRPAVRDGRRVLEIITNRYGFIIATVEPDDPQMRATAEIMAQSWTMYQAEQVAQLAHKCPHCGWFGSVHRTDCPTVRRRSDQT